jgi:hypothetical protein
MSLQHNHTILLTIIALLLLSSPASAASTTYTIVNLSSITPSSITTFCLVPDNINQSRVNLVVGRKNGSI